MASETHPTPVASPTRQRVSAWIALALSLIFPLTVVVNVGVTLAWQRQNGEPLVLESVASGFLYLMGIGCYIVTPLAIVATFLASMVLTDSRGHNKVAWAAAILGALSLLTIVIVIAVGIIVTNNNQ